MVHAEVSQLSPMCGQTSRFTRIFPEGKNAGTSKLHRVAGLVERSLWGVRCGTLDIGA